MKKALSFIGLCASVLVLALFTACPNPVSDDTSKDKDTAKQSYSITFNANGGIGTMANQTIVSGTSATLTANAFTRSGYAFSGWAASADATSAAYADGASYTMGAADITLYAVWTVVPSGSFSITFNANGGTGTMANQTIVSGASAALTANAFTREGYTFSGWATSAEATSVAYTDGASYKMGDANVTLYAVWTGKNYTISFNSNGGLDTMVTQTIACGSSAALAINTFTHYGDTFAGWATSTESTTVAYANEANYTMGSTDVTLYAVWAEVSTGTTTLASLTAGYGTVIEITQAASGSYTQATSTTAGFVHNLSAFNLGKYEVTYELWYAVYQWAITNGYTFANAGREGNDGTIGAAPTSAKLEPVTTVNWRDCIVWCNAYSEMSRKTPVYYRDSGYATPIRSSIDVNYGSTINITAGSYDAPYVNASSKGYRLPTEGEWQYAASCAATYPYDYVSGADAKYDVASGGSDIDGVNGVQYSSDVAWYATSKTQDVGTKAANKYGIHDLSGNVWEWCFDWYGTLPTATETPTDYTGATSGSYRVLRGGSWIPGADALQVGYRYGGSPYLEYNDSGFRVCCGR